MTSVRITEADVDGFRQKLDALTGGMDGSFGILNGLNLPAVPSPPQI